MTRTLAIAVIVAVLGLGGWYYTSQDAAPGGADYVFEETASGFGLTEMTLGNAEAPVTVIEYASYTCPHCASFHAGNYKQLKADYIDTDKINFVYREVYFDRPGLWASMVARCGGADKFFGISDLIYKDQQGWARAGGPAEIADALGKLGRLAGLDGDTLDACMADADKAENLTKWQEANMAAHGIESTPSFVINGTTYRNMSYEDMKGLIETALGN